MLWLFLYVKMLTIVRRDETGHHSPLWRGTLHQRQAHLLRGLHLLRPHHDAHHGIPRRQAVWVVALYRIRTSDMQSDSSDSLSQFTLSEPMLYLASLSRPWLAITCYNIDIECGQETSGPKQSVKGNVETWMSQGQGHFLFFPWRKHWSFNVIARTNKCH